MVEINENVTYLLGAGASASKNALPLNDGLIDKMESVLLRNTFNDNPYKQLFVSNVKNFISNARIYGSIDSYARICYDNLNGNHHLKDELLAIKKLIWIYFTLEYKKGKLDNRYIKLLTKICNRPNNSVIRLKHNVNILTWNYDLQLEEAILKLEHSIRIKDTQSGIILNAYPNIEFLINNEDEEAKRPRIDDGGIIHLNGVAGHIFIENNPYADFIYDLNDENKMEIYKNLNTYTSYGEYSKIGDSIKFAWEKDGRIADKLREYSSSIASKTDHLVIIGYSFPDINREFDETILSKMDSLKTITFQTTDSLAKERLKDIINKYSIFKKVEITIIENFNEFYLPLK